MYFVAFNWIKVIEKIEINKKLFPKKKISIIARSKLQINSPPQQIQSNSNHRIITGVWKHELRGPQIAFGLRFWFCWETDHNRREFWCMKALLKCRISKREAALHTKVSKIFVLVRTFFSLLIYIFRCSQHSQRWNLKTSKAIRFTEVWKLNRFTTVQI